MDIVLVEYEISTAILTAFRDLARYYVASHDPHADGAREHLRKLSRGSDAFFTSFYDDLEDICTHCGQINSWPECDDEFKRDIGALLGCLATVIEPREPTESSSEKLERFRQGTSGWDCRKNLSLSAEQLAWLRKHADLQFLTDSQRRRLLKRTTTVVQSLPGENDDDFRDDPKLAKKDHWALKTAVDVCEPLQDVYNVLLREWTCECNTPDEHNSVLASFAMPCRSDGANMNYLLRFMTSCEKRIPWNTLFLDIADDNTVHTSPDSTDSACTVTSAANDAVQDEGSVPIASLHDRLTQGLMRNQSAAKLRFCSVNKGWIVTAVDAVHYRDLSMVSLASLFTENSPHPIGERPFVERLSLALLVAYAFLELGNSPWFPYDVDSINIWFHQTDDSKPMLLQPYIEVDLADDGDLSETQSISQGVLRLVNPAMPCLPLLGKLILELVRASPIPELGSVPGIIAEYRRQMPLYELHVLGAVDTCFFDSNFREAGIHGNERQRERFLEHVICRLQGLLAKCETSLEAEINKAQALQSQKHSNRRRQRSSAGVPVGARLYSPVVKALDDQSRPRDADLSHVLHDNGSIGPCEEHQQLSAQDFVKRLRNFHDFVPRKHEDMHPVRVALLDTGLRLDKKGLRLYSHRDIEVRSWLNDVAEGTPVSVGDDPCGHGTRCAIAFLQCSSATTELYVGQVFESSNSDADNTRTPRGDPGRVAKAIRYAVSKWQVDIISMSFGYELEVEVVHEALKFAEANNVLLIAAASNVGCNTARARRWPGNRFNVLSMCATEGNGYPYKNNPPHKHNAWNFATLGVMVPTWSKPEYMTGTSIATPIAAGIAASVIELVRSTEREYLARYPEHQSRLKAAKDAMSRAENMGKIFGHMAHKKGGYDYLHPSNLLTRTMTPVKLLEAILDKLEE